MIRFASLLLLVLTAGIAHADDSPHVMFVVGDPEYRSAETLPPIAEELRASHGLRCTVLVTKQRETIPTPEKLADADLAVFFVELAQLPKEMDNPVRRYLDSGKPIIGMRTSIHGFQSWNKLGNRLFGALYKGHADGQSGGNAGTRVTKLTDAKVHPILTGVGDEFEVRSWIYFLPAEHRLAKFTPLLQGEGIDKQNRGSGIVHPVAWTFEREGGGRVFGTTLGHPQDFKSESFHRLLINAIHWTLDRPAPTGD